MADDLQELDPECAAFYCDAIAVLQSSRIDFLVGGAYALAIYTGITRHTKDLDIFIRAADVDRALSGFEQRGYRAEKTFPHWLAKIFQNDNFTDLIYAAGNGLAEVDDSWFENAREGEFLGQRVKILAPEELIWMKAFIQERERYDGADVAHLIQSCGDSLDWRRLRQRFAQDWRVLFSHLILFGYIYPSEWHRVPAGLMREMQQRLTNESFSSERVCRGTLLSRAQYLPDVEERGFRDARLEPRTSMSADDVAEWTAAIEPKDRPQAETRG